MDTLIDVLVDEDGKEVHQVAKIVRETKKTYHVKFMSPHKSGLYRYDNELTEIEKECVSGFYDSTDEKDAGFVRVDGGYQPIEEYDDDYEPSEEDESDTDDESVVESESEEENLEEQ